VDAYWAFASSSKEHGDDIHYSFLGFSAIGHSYVLQLASEEIMDSVRERERERA
jgi:hypothetical protein